LTVGITTTFEEGALRGNGWAFSPAIADSGDAECDDHDQQRSENDP
jgi:hypothetical protein